MSTIAWGLVGEITIRFFSNLAQENIVPYPEFT